MNQSNKIRLEELQNKIENRMKELIPLSDCTQQTVIKAMRYSLEAGGKRLRPVLLIEICRALGGSEEYALDSACALEMLHTFSLIHDDLPCMDDDDLRRGRPSCHVAFGEANALLAGDALAILPFEVIAGDQSLSAEQKVLMIRELSFSAGTNGMIGGQTIDLEQGEDIKSGKVLLEMYRMKTSALLQCACRMGAYAAGASEGQVARISEYGEKLGLAFQIVDDILDMTGTEAELGKPIGSDKEQGKSTYAALYGLETAKETARRLTDEALEILGEFEPEGLLTELTEHLLRRKY